MPRGVAGTTEMSHPKTSPYPRRNAPFTSRQMAAPIAAFTMACILFVYARTSIRAAKENAQRHRNADSGGEGLSLFNESRRRHGLAERIDSRSSVNELAAGARDQFLGRKDDGSKTTSAGTKGRSVEDDRLRAALGRKGGDGG